MDILKIQQEEQFHMKLVKAFNIGKNPKYDGYQRGLSSMFYKVFDKTSEGSGANIEVKQNQQLADDLHKPNIKKFKRR